MSEAHSPHLSSHLGVPARTSNQLTEVTVAVGFADHPHYWRRISKLSQKYWRDKHQRSTVRKRTPSASVGESPPRPAKARTNIALMHRASTSTPWYHNVASVAAASVIMDAANAAGLSAAAAHAVSAAAFAASSNSSDSDNSDIMCSRGPIGYVVHALIQMRRIFLDC